MASEQIISRSKNIVRFLSLCFAVLLTGCSPMKLPFVIVNNSDAAAIVKYRLVNCYDIEHQRWRDEDIPIKMNADVYFSDAEWQWTSLAESESEMTEKLFSVDVEVENPKAQRKCVERNYTVNLTPKTALRVSVDDFDPNVGMNFLEIKGTRGTLRFEEINVWKMFRNIERNPDRIGENFRSYEIIFNGS